ncbi:WD repeat-containing protein 34 [Borealophlyctis nickersoniae]|nr:WD repeat-containing protein 34 [Borealophlyctis nickersoniae]
MVCTEVAWNKTGSVVGVAYGRYDHENWCTHKGMLCTWNITLRDLNPDTASFATEVSSCLMCIAFHPELPSVIAGGGFNGMLLKLPLQNVAIINHESLADMSFDELQGDVMIWQTNKEQDPLTALSKSSEFAHQEPVAKIMWVPGAKGRQYQLVTIGNDGKILIWDPSDLSMPKAGSQLSSTNIPRHIVNLASGGAGSRQDSVLGGTSISFSKENPQEYFTTTETGYVLKCRTTNATQIELVQKSVPPRYTNPIVFAYTPHSGPVNSISCSPHHRNLILTGASDGSVRVYNALQAKTVLAFDPSSRGVYAVEWSPYRSTVFACVTGEGAVCIYDLSHTPQHLPLTTLQSSANASTPATALAFNAKRCEYLATGDAGGVVKVWRLSTQLGASGGVRERAILEALGRLVDDADGDGEDL